MNVRSSRAGANRPENTRLAIQRAALQLFAERGFHGTSVPEIARVAGVAAGTMYRHFPSKEQLVNVLYRDAKARFMSALASDFPAEQSPRAQFRWFFLRISTFARENSTELAFLELHHHGDYLDQESRQLEQSSLDAFYAFVDLEATRAVLKPLPARALVILVWGLLAGLFKAWRLGHIEWDDALIAEAEICAWDAIACQ